MRFLTLPLLGLCLLGMAPPGGSFGNHRLCGIQLVEALLFVCGEKGLFYQPGRRVRGENIRVMMRDTAPFLREARVTAPFLREARVTAPVLREARVTRVTLDREGDGRLRLAKRGIVEQCCHFYCNYHDLENYCNV